MVKVKPKRGEIPTDHMDCFGSQRLTIVLKR